MEDQAKGQMKTSCLMELNVDLVEAKTAQNSSNLVIIGDIHPPLEDDEIEVLCKDPKFCSEQKVLWENLSIALEEGKVKVQFNEMNKQDCVVPCMLLIIFCLLAVKVLCISWKKKW